MICQRIDRFALTPCIHPHPHANTTTDTEFIFHSLRAYINIIPYPSSLQPQPSFIDLCRARAPGFLLLLHRTESRSVRLLAFVALYKIRLTLFTASQPALEETINAINVRIHTSTLNVSQGRRSARCLHCRGKQQQPERTCIRPELLSISLALPLLIKEQDFDKSVGPLKYQLLRALATWHKNQSSV